MSPPVFLGISVFLIVFSYIAWEMVLLYRNQTPITGMVRAFYHSSPGAVVLLVGNLGYLGGHFFWCAC